MRYPVGNTNLLIKPVFKVTEKAACVGRPDVL